MQDIIPPEESKQKSAKKIGGSLLNTPQEPTAVDDPIIIEDEKKTADEAPKKRLFHKLKFWNWSFDWWSNWGRWKKITVSFLVVLFIAAATAAALYSTYWRQNQPELVVTKHKKPAPTTVASPLTGLQIDPSLAGRPVTGIMIENSPDARPQSGIQDAGVVFEAIAEGGITRFMTLYQDAQPQYIGPVRSLRPYYLDMAAPFQASIAHVGGSPEALSEVRNGHYRDIDQFFNSGYYWRISSRFAPHNVYTSFEKLDQLNKAKGYTSSQYTPWLRKKDKKLATPTAATIDFQISSPLYYAHYDYDAASNTYNRSEGGAAHKMLTSAGDKTGVQLHPNVVIAAVMNYGIASDGQHSTYADTGSGTAYIFQDGGVTVGQWHKADNATMITFTDDKGAPFKINAGQTWVTLVADTGKVHYTAPPPPPPAAPPAKTP